MEVILLKEHESLGEIGDIINVKPGYARNFLFPKGIAVRSSKRNIALADEPVSYTHLTLPTTPYV